METNQATGRVDGRTARTERTRAAIVEATLALIREGDLRPTAERIAERAGISLRGLWTKFKDMETLLGATGERVLQLQIAATEPVSADLPLPRRIDEYCQQRARLLEQLAPSARAAALKEPFSAQLRHTRRRHLDLVRSQLEALFGAELDRLGPAREVTLHALTAATTWSAWSFHRDAAGLDVDAAREVMTRTVTALLTPG